MEYNIFMRYLYEDLILEVKTKIKIQIQKLNIEKYRLKFIYQLIFISNLI